MSVRGVLTIVVFGGGVFVVLGIEVVCDVYGIDDGILICFFVFILFLNGLCVNFIFKLRNCAFFKSVSEFLTFGLMFVCKVLSSFVLLFFIMGFGVFSVF